MTPEEKWDNMSLEERQVLLDKLSKFLLANGWTSCE